MADQQINFSLGTISGQSETEFQKVDELAAITIDVFEVVRCEVCP